MTLHVVVMLLFTLNVGGRQVN